MERVPGLGIGIAQAGVVGLELGDAGAESLGILYGQAHLLGGLGVLGRAAGGRDQLAVFADVFRLHGREFGGGRLVGGEVGADAVETELVARAGLGAGSHACQVARIHLELAGGELSGLADGAGLRRLVSGRAARDRYGFVFSDFVVGV